MLREAVFDDTFCELGKEGQVGDWTVAGEVVFIKAGFFKQWRDDGLLEGCRESAGRQ